MDRQIYEKIKIKEGSKEARKERRKIKQRRKYAYLIQFAFL